jgi:PKD repeat protein
MRLYVVVVAVSVLAAGCSVGDGAAPTLSGPSEFGLSVTIAASPSQVPRDGASQSVISVSVRDASGRPVQGQLLSVSADVGGVSQNQIVTNSDGTATFSFIAPAASSGSNEAVIRVLPVGSDAQNAVTRTVTVLLGGTSTTAPTASFTFSPTAPTLAQEVVFDASASTDEFVRCGDLCTYTWDFGGEAIRSGRVVTYGFRAVRTYPVRLTVTDSAGSAGTTTQNVTVVQGTLPTPAFSFSPASPGQFQPVNFTAAASRAGEGRTVTSYEWRFGDGSTDTGVTASHAYAVTGTYVVTLTVTDSAGLQSSVSQSVVVVNGVTAAFVFSPQNPLAGQTVFFNAEESRGSDSGFGTRNPITRYIWHFGDSTTVEETSSPIISHAFATAQTFRVTLTVVDSAGRRQTVFEDVDVE